MDLLLFGETYFDGPTDKHYDVPTLVRHVGRATPAMEAAATGLIKAKRLTPGQSI